MDNLDLTPEYRKKTAILQAEKELYISLVLQINDLLEFEKPNLEAVYMLEVGQKKLELLQLQAEVARLKFRMELLQAAINRNEKVDLDHIQAKIDRHLANYVEQIKQKIEEINAAYRHVNSFMSPEESEKLRKLYYELAKKLHPDTNPNQSDDDRQLWHLVAKAYESSDLQSLENLKAVVDGRSEMKTVITDIDTVTKEIEKFRTKNRELQSKIIQINSEFPFAFRDNLNNRQWIESENETSEKQIVELKKLRDKYTDYVNLMMEILQ